MGDVKGRAEESRDEWCAMATEFKELCEQWQAMAESAQEEIARLREALEPSGATKAAYIGEFHFDIEDRDEDGEECRRRVTVPWTTVKEIMAVIKARSSLAHGGGE